MARARAVWVLALATVASLLPSTGVATVVTTAPARTGLTVATTVATTVAEAQPTAPAQPGRADGTVGTVEDDGLTLTRVAPVVAAPGEPVTIGGLLDVDALGLDLAASAPAVPDPSEPAVTPPAQPPVATVEVRLGPRAPEQRADVTEWAGGTEASPGRVLASADVVTAPDPTVERVPFSVTVADLPLPARTAYGVVPVSVEVRLPGAGEPAAVLRTFLGFQVRKEYEPLELALVVPFTLPADPALVAGLGEERTAAWEALVGESGTLRERLASATGADVVWALDPALLGPGPAPEDSDEDVDGPEGTTGPTTTSAPSGSSGSSAPTPGTSRPTAGSAAPSAPQTTTDPDATTGPDVTTDPEETTGPETPEQSPEATERRLRTDFAALLLEEAAGREVLLLPRHDADVAALPAGGAEDATSSALRSLIARALEVEDAHTLLLAAGAEVTPTAWPVAGGWSTALDAELQALPRVPAGPGEADRAWAVLASTTSLTGSVRGPFPAGTGSTVLPVDESLSAWAGTAGGQEGTLAPALALMADSLVLLDERPGTTRRVIVALERDSAAAASGGALMAVLDDVPWLAPSGLAGPDHEGALSEEAPAAPVPPVLVDSRARELALTLDRLPVAASVRSETGSELATRGADTLAQLTSARWRGAEEAWTTAYAPIGEDVAETFAGLTIPSRDISFLADSGLLRVAVENTLDTGIENATLDLTVEHPILRVESGPQPVVVGPGSRTTVGFEASAIASGRVSVTATLRAPDGTVLGEPTQFSVRVSPTSDWIYWVLGTLAALVLAIGVARTVMRRRPST